MSIDDGLATQIEDDEVGQPLHVPTKKSNKLLIVGITAMVLVFTVAVAGFWAYNKFINRPTITPSRVLPANTLAYFTIDPSPNESQKKAFEDISTLFQAQPGFREAWHDLVNTATEGLGADTLPLDPAALADFDSLSNYLGSDITLALMPPGTADLDDLRSADSEEAMAVMRRNLVGLVDLDFNPLNKKGPLAELKQQSDDKVIVDTTEKYRGIEIRRYISNTLTLYFSLLPDTSTAVVGADPEPVRTIIDQFVLDEGLKYDPTYKALLADLPTERVATFYVNLSEISRQVSLMRDQATASPLEGQGAWMAAFSGNPEGLQVNIVAQTEFDGAGLLLFGRPGINIEVNPLARPRVASLYDVPGDSLAFLVGTDLRSTADLALESLRREDPETEARLETEIKDNTGLDLRRDIIPLLGGDYVASFSASGAPEKPVIASVFQLKLSPESRAKSGDVVPRLVQGISNGSPVNETVDGDNRFYTLPASAKFAIALTDDRLIYVQDETWAAARERAKSVALGAGKGFGGTDQWKAISKHLPVDSNLIAYADIEAMRETYEHNMSAEQNDEFQQISPFLRPISYILVGSANYQNLATKEPKPVSKLRSHTVVVIGLEK